jgi:hypothetical protein
MSTGNTPAIRSIGWLDLTVDNAENIKYFYEKVTGLRAEPLSMGTYDDYVMKSTAGTPVAGICHARGSNANLPPYWLPYITVENIEKSIHDCTALGGKISVPVKNFGDEAKYCIIQDPAGAYVALFQPL